MAISQMFPFFEIFFLIGMGSAIALPAKKLRYEKKKAAGYMMFVPLLSAYFILGLGLLNALLCILSNMAGFGLVWLLKTWNRKPARPRIPEGGNP